MSARALLEKRPGGVARRPWASPCAHGALVEGGAAPSARGAQAASARVALLLRLGVVPAGEPAVVVAVSAARRRDAADAAATAPERDQGQAARARRCAWASEPKAAAAARPRWRRAAGTTTASLLGQTIGDLAVEAMVEAMTANDREKMLASNASAAARDRTGVRDGDGGGEGGGGGGERARRRRASRRRRGGERAGARRRRAPGAPARGQGGRRDAHAPGRARAMDVDRIAEPKGLATPDAETAAEKA